MPITYPLSLPTTIGMSQITFFADNADAMSESPFSYSQQVFKHPGERWRASVSVAPTKKELSEPWVAFLMSLRGRTGTFLLGDPNCRTPRGTALSNRVNLFDYSEQFDNAAWTKGNATITANSIASPDGLTTADTLVENTATSAHNIAEAFSWVAGTVYTLSIYAKEQSDRNIRLLLPTAQFGGVSSIAIFDTTNGQVLSVSAGVTAQSESVGNGWFRFSISKAATVTASGNVDIRLVEGTNVTTYLGDGVSGVYIWGAQLEVGSVPTTYQPIFLGYGPFVNGAGQTGTSLIVDGASPNEPAYLSAGDYIQLGTGSSSRLFKVLADVATNDSGQATIDVWPRIRTAPPDNSTVLIQNTVGLFRLSSGVASWQIDAMSSYGITFDCVEVI